MERDSVCSDITEIISEKSEAEQGVEPNGSSVGSSFLGLVVTSGLFAVGSLGRSVRNGDSAAT